MKIDVKPLHNTSFKIPYRRTVIKGFSAYILGIHTAISRRDLGFWAYASRVSDWSLRRVIYRVWSSRGVGKEIQVF
ncbi:hypothetical protein PM082_010182 [Marasmius tenuissimus]|nr:hypothetical protein PM082_010182 [Marasmius tenuissimus]